MGIYPAVIKNYKFNENDFSFSSNCIKYIHVFINSSTIIYGNYFKINTYDNRFIKQINKIIGIISDFFQEAWDNFCHSIRKLANHTNNLLSFLKVQVIVKNKNKDLAVNIKYTTDDIRLEELMFFLLEDKESFENNFKDNSCSIA